MGIELPVLEYVPSWVLGGEWPDGDEDQVWELAEAWHAQSESVTECLNQANTQVNQLLQSYSGAGATALRTFWQERAEKIAELAQAAEELSQFCDGTALQIQYTKLSIIANLIILMITIISLIAAAFATFGASTAGIPVAQQATSVVVKELIKQLLKAILMGAVKGLVMAAGVDLIIQGIQVAGGRRDGIDWDQTATVALSGAISGAISGAAGFGASRMNLNSPGAVAAGNAAAGAAGSATGNFAATLATGGSLEDAANSAANGALTGGLQGAGSGLSNATETSTTNHWNENPRPLDPNLPLEQQAPAGDAGYISPDGTVTRPNITDLPPGFTPGDPPPVPDHSSFPGSVGTSGTDPEPPDGED